MPTAIVRIYTPDGFVIAADGLSRNSATKTIISHDLQKIYRVGSSSLALSFLGAARLGNATNDDPSEVLFDFISAFSRAAERISPTRCRNLQAYGEKLTGLVQRALEEAVGRGNISLPSIPSRDPDDRGQTIVVVCADGYCAGAPQQSRFRFCHENQQLLPPEVTSHNPLPNIPQIIGGFKELGDKIASGDQSLSHYMLAIELDDSYSDDLRTAIQFSRALIAASAGPEGGAINPEISSNIGGRTHIATITPQKGFRWVAKYEPVR